MGILQKVRGLIANLISNNLIHIPIFLNKGSMAAWALNPATELNDAGTSDFRSPVDPFSHNDYRYNPGDGKWYKTPPAPDYGQFAWENPASPEMHSKLESYREWGQAYNEYRLKKIEWDNMVKERQLSSHSNYYDNALKKAAISFSELATFPQRTDPFTLDLDDDGIETVGINATVPLMFDLDDSGIKKSVGWIAADDGLLVWDRNGNGMIDSGAELFGDATPRYDADGVLIGRAVDGFAALAQEDGNADGNVDRLDAHWSALRVWQDANQDGVSQGVELKTLDELGVVSIHVSKSENSSLLANGNVLADLGTYTRSDGRQGSAAVTAALADVDLAVDTFHSQFTDAIPLTEQAQTLPGMQGSGQVRSLREAASLPTPAGAALAALLLQFSQATSRAAQQTLIDPLIKAWADTSAMATTFDGAYAGRELTVDMQTIYHPTLYAGSPDYQAMADKLSIVERFNGRLYQPKPQGDGPVALTLWHNPQLLLQKSYDALKTSLYESLALQTRLSPLLDSIEFSVSANGVEMNFSRTAAQLTARLAANPADGLGDLLDFNRATRTMLQGSAWNGDALLTSYLRRQPPSAELQTVLAENGIRIKGHAGWSGDGGSGDDIVVGDAADDTLYGNGGDDMLDGDGGQDLLVGGAGNDTYLFRRGSGHDRINAYDTAQERIETLVLDGLNVGDIRAEKWGDYDLRADPSRQRRLLSFGRELRALVKTAIHL